MSKEYDNVNTAWRIQLKECDLEHIEVELYGECKMQEDAIEACNTRALTPAQEHAEELALLLFDLLFACLCGSLQEKQTLLDRAEALLSDIKLQELQEKIPALRKIKAQQEA